MKKNLWNYKDAIDEVKKCRPQVSPNIGFERQLMLYERKIMFKLDRDRVRISKTLEKNKNKISRKAITPYIIDIKKQK